MILKRAFNYTPIGSLEVCRNVKRIYETVPNEERHETINNNLVDLDFVSKMTVLL